MGVARKQALSLRVSVSDLKKIKAISSRLEVRDSDVVRVAIRLLLTRLSPISDPELRGRQLVPMFLELWPELGRNFELDAARLDEIINAGVAESERVSLEDLHMITMSDAPQASDAPFRALPHAAIHADAPAPEAVPFERRRNNLKRYLFDKYLYPSGRRSAASRGAED